MLGLKANFAALHAPSALVGGVARTCISRGVEASFNFVARDFFRNYQRWQPQVVELEPSGDIPAMVGTTARQVTLDRGIRSESTFAIAELEPCRRFALAGVSEPFQSSYEFEPEEANTALTFKFELREIELSMRPFVKLIRAALQDGAEQTVENLKNLLERGASGRVGETQTI